MPTGYTHKIAEGISFKEFAYGCARNFGALVLMRDDPADAPIPEKFEPSDYNAKAASEAEARLVQLNAMTADEIVSACDSDFAAAYAHWQKRKADRIDLRAKYEAMLAQARAYVAPSPDHHEYKNFMISQILQSIDFDCNHSHDKQPVRQKPMDWHSIQREKAIRDITYHTAEQNKEIKRTDGRNRWVQQLRDSLESAQQ